MADDYFVVHQTRGEEGQTRICQRTQRRKSCGAGSQEYIHVPLQGRYISGSACAECSAYSRRAHIGTFISVYKKSDDGKVLATPILLRLRNQYTLLRRSNDPSLLLQAILDFSQFSSCLILCVLIHVRSC